MKFHPVKVSKEELLIPDVSWGLVYLMLSMTRIAKFKILFPEASSLRPKSHCLSVLHENLSGGWAI